MVVTPTDPLELAAFAGFEQPKAVYAERGEWSACVHAACAPLHHHHHLC